MSASLLLNLRRPIYGKSQSKAYTGTAGLIDADLPSGCNAVMVWCTTNACVKVGPNSSGTPLAATTADVPVAANTMVVLPVEPPTVGGSETAMRVSAIQIATGGTVYVQPLAD